MADVTRRRCDVTGCENAGRRWLIQRVDPWTRAEVDLCDEHDLALIGLVAYGRKEKARGKRTPRGAIRLHTAQEGQEGP